MILMYEETNEEKEKVKKVTEYLKKFYGYAKIKHDKDIETETGELKKEHIHIVVKLSDAKTRKALAKELDIEYRHIEPSSKLRNALRYLIHADEDEDKFKYDKSEIETNIEYELNKATTNTATENEEEKVMKITEYILNEKPKKLSQLLIWAVNNNCYSELRRNSVFFREMIKEER